MDFWPINRFVAIDCETTGLDPRDAEIIEIALLRFSDGGPSEELTYFVNPGAPIPLRNQRLTGITDEMLASAPRFQEIIDDIISFIGDLPVVGHNVGFDLKFIDHNLRKQGLDDLKSPAYDTLRLAALFFPEEPSLKLSILADKFNLSSEVSHRANDDARLSGLLLLKLQEYIMQQPRELLELLASVGPVDDTTCFHFLRLLLKNSDIDNAKPQAEILPDVMRIDQNPITCPPGKGYVSGDFASSAAALFEDGGVLQSMVPGFEYRAGQPEMARSFAAHLWDGGFNAVEAGCGLGKSCAYLAPAIMAAGAGKRPIILSTYTRNLQDQLADKDVPALAPLHPGGLKYTTLKGRANYLCLNRVADPSGRLFGMDRLSAFERALLIGWVHNTREGDIDKLNFYILNNFNNLKSHLNFVRAEGEFCEMDECKWKKRCFLRASRKRAAESDIIITNHSLLFSGFEPGAEGPKILPPFKHVIFDEAHHIEDSLGQALQLSFDSYMGTRLLKRFKSLLDRSVFDDISAATMASLKSGCPGLTVAIDDLARAGDHCIRKLRPSGVGTYAPRLVVGPDVVETSDWMNFCGEAATFLIAIGECRSKLEKVVAETKSVSAKTRLGGFAEFLKGYEETVRRTVSPDFRTDAIWLDSPVVNKGSRLRITVWPLSVAAHFRAKAKELESCQFTSGTLSAAGDFRFFISQLGLEDCDVDFSTYLPPFDMPSQARILIPTDLEPPSSQEKRGWESLRQTYVARTAEVLSKIIQRYGGHTMCLFTSTQDMDDIGETVRPVIEGAGITCLLQFRDGGKSALIEEFVNNPRTALLGTRSFFEGVDISNAALKCLVMVRLPFPHPEEPVHLSRLRKMAEDGEDGFTGLSLPITNQVLRQAAGRLIRTPHDTGVIIFLDNRLINRSYGEVLLSGLDSIPVEIGSLDMLLETGAKFLGI